MKKAMRNQDVKEFVKEIESSYGISFSKKDRFEIDEDIVIVNNEPLFFYYEKKLLPTLKLLMKQDLLKKITVDMGAIRFVTAGADVMRPGITGIEEGIAKEEVIVIIDETHGKPLAIGLALYQSEDMQNMDSGKVIKTIHYVGDRIWNYY